LGGYHSSYPQKKYKCTYIPPAFSRIQEGLGQLNISALTLF